MGMFDHKYIEFDELGAMFMKCMACGQLIVERFYKDIPIRSAPPTKEKVITLMKLGNYKQIRVALSDGSYMEPMVCINCEKTVSIDIAENPELADKLINQVSVSAKDNALHAGRSTEEADNAFNTMRKLKALKRIPRNKTWQESHAEAVVLAKQFEKKEK